MQRLAGSRHNAQSPPGNPTSFARTVKTFLVEMHQPVRAAAENDEGGNPPQQEHRHWCSPLKFTPFRKRATLDRVPAGSAVSAYAFLNSGISTC